jgi:catalase
MALDAGERLMDNIAEAMQGVPMEIVARQAEHFRRAGPAYGAGVARRMGLPETPARAAAAE